jgi:hypothetical protein
MDASLRQACRRVGRVGLRRSVTCELADAGKRLRSRFRGDGVRENLYSSVVGSACEYGTLPFLSAWMSPVTSRLTRSGRSTCT